MESKPKFKKNGYQVEILQIRLRATEKLKKMSTNPNQRNYSGYRPDIDGLRAVSIILVVLFHFFPKTFPGGFIGVDIFFVISGYLISRNIFHNHSDRSFSFIDFYTKRCRRIFPALIVVLLSMGLLGRQLLSWNDFEYLCEQIIGASTFTLNFNFNSEIGYFAANAQLKPFLNLWSLSVEEQFYLLWPLVIYFGFKHKLNFKWVFSFLIAVSFSANIWSIHQYGPQASFYLLHTRVWELLIGGVLAASELPNIMSMGDSTLTKISPNLRSGLGQALLLVAMLTISTDVVYPGCGPSSLRFLH